MPRGQTGYAAHALAAIDLALWDIKGKALGQPVWRLLGGARQRVPVYATFGFGFFDREQLAAAAKLWVAQGFTRLKMTVGNEALRRRDSSPLIDVISEDAARVRAVREAVGPDVELFIDANCNLDLYHATQLAEMIKPYGIAFFEEPLTQNDVPQMAELRRSTGIPLACGQNEGLAFRFRDLLLNKAVDYAAAERRDRRRLHPMPEDRGAGGGVQRADRQWRRLGVPQHAPACRRRERHAGRVPLPGGGDVPADYRGLPKPKDGWLTLPETPGLGFEPEPRCDPRDRQAPAVAGQCQGVTDRHPRAILRPGRVTAAAKSRVKTWEEA